MAHVLIVDDDAGIREALSALLEEDGHTVLAADDGEAALAIIQTASHPLVVLLDHVMPRLTGMAVLQEVARKPAVARRHAYILVTASARIADLAAELHEVTSQFTAEHVQTELAVLRKPFDIEDVLATVARAAARLSAS